MSSLAEKAKLVFFSLKSPFGYDRIMRDEDIQKTEDAIRSPMVDDAPIAHREDCAVLIDQMLADPAFGNHPRTKLALTIAARAIRRGRHLYAYEKMENLRSYFAEDTPPPSQEEAP